MGCLDPQIDKERTFELLRKRNAIRAELEFNGGHDEGNVERITLTLADGTHQDLVVWYCGGYRMDKNEQGEFVYVPSSVAANEDEELSDLLQGPVDLRFGSWGGVEYTSGSLVWDVEEGTARMNYTQDEPVEHEHEVF